MKRRTFLERLSATHAIACIAPSVVEDARAAPTIAHQAPDSAGQIPGDEFNFNGVALHAVDINTSLNRHPGSGIPYNEVNLVVRLIDPGGLVSTAHLNRAKCAIRYRKQGREVEGRAYVTTCLEEYTKVEGNITYAVFVFSGPVAGLA